MIDCEKCMYRKNGGCGYDKNGCGFVFKTGDLISREEVLMCLTGEYLEGQEYKLDDEICKFIKRMQNVPTIPAIPISVIEQIKAEIKNYLEDEKYSEDGISDVGIGLELALNIIDRVVKEYEA